MLEAPIKRFLARLSSVKPAGDRQWMARCPAHDDATASLSIGVGDDGRVLLKCQAQCPTQAVCDALGIGLRDLFHRNNGSPAPETVHDYCDESGKVLYQVVRKLGKKFAQRRPDGAEGWIWKLGNTRRVPYRLPELLAADSELLVFVPEGEKDVDNLRSRGLIATCNSGGAGKWRDEYSEFLRGRVVIILADNDKAGRKHAQQVAESLRGIAAEVRIVLLPGLADGGDVSDWLDSGGTVNELKNIVHAASVYESADSEPTPSQSPVRLSQLCDQFLASLRPEWHRDHRHIYFSKLDRTVTLPNLWTLADDSIIDRVVGTVEGAELVHGESAPKYRARLGLFEKAIRIAGAKLMTRLPAVVDVDRDATLDEGTLSDRLINWFLRDRSFRADNGNPVSITYQTWCAGLPPEDVWHRCFSAPVFGRIDEPDGLPRVAVSGPALAADLHYASSRKLAADLRAAGFAETNKTISVTAKKWRVWLFSPQMIKSITGGHAQ